MKVIAIGDNCIDDYIHQGEKYVGGCSVNFSVYTKQLGGESAYLGAVGQDENGTLITNTLKAHGIDVSHVHIMNGKTAVTEVSLVDGDRKFLSYDEGVLKNLALSEADVAYIKTFDLLHTSVYGNIDYELKHFMADMLIVFDFGPKLSYANKEMVLDCIDYAFFSYTQDDAFIRKFLCDAVSHGLECAVATLGEHGSIAYDGKEWYVQGIRKVPVVDTIGAGDSFIAGFSIAVLSGKSIPECLNAGALKAEETIQHFGAI